KPLHYEVQRPIDLIEDGARVIQATRLHDADQDEPRSMRRKAGANDCRELPAPDLPPVVTHDAYIAAVRATPPDLLVARSARVVSEYGLSEYDANVLTSSRAMADFLEEGTRICGDAKLSAKWVTVDLLGLLNKLDLDIAASPIKPAQLGTMISRIKDNTISGKLAKTVFEALAEGEQDVDQIIESRGLKQVTDTGAIEKLVDEVLAANPAQVEQYRGGKEAVFGFFVGQAMKISKGKANP